MTSAGCCVHHCVAPFVIAHRRTRANREDPGTRIWNEPPARRAWLSLELRSVASRSSHSELTVTFCLSLVRRRYRSSRSPDRLGPSSCRHPVPCITVNLNLASMSSRPASSSWQGFNGLKCRDGRVGETEVHLGGPVPGDGLVGPDRVVFDPVVLGVLWRA